MFCWFCRALKHNIHTVLQMVFTLFHWSTCNGNAPRNTGMCQQRKLLRKAKRSVCVCTVRCVVPCLSSKVAQCMWMLGLYVRWTSQARLKTARASSTLCSSRYWVYWSTHTHGTLIHTLKYALVYSFSKYESHTNTPFSSPWSRTPHTERRRSGNAQRGFEPCSRRGQQQHPLVLPEAVLWPPTPLKPPGLDLIRESAVRAVDT